MQKLSIAALFAAAMAVVPTSVDAVTLGHTISTISKIINGLIPIVLAIAVLIFFWGLAKYLLSAGDSTERVKGINVMIMGIIAIFVMVSIWGIIRILQETFKVDQAKPIIPESIERSYN